MASSGSKAKRAYEAKKRFDAAIGQIGKLKGIELRPVTGYMTDRGLKPVLELENLADFLEEVAASISESRAIRRERLRTLATD